MHPGVRLQRNPACGGEFKFEFVWLKEGCVENSDPREIISHEKTRVTNSKCELICMRASLLQIWKEKSA